MNSSASPVVSVKFPMLTVKITCNGQLLSGRGQLKLMVTSVVMVCFMVTSVVRKLYQTGTAIRMHFFYHVLTFKMADRELSQKCDILLFGFVFTELALI